MAITKIKQADVGNELPLLFLLLQMNVTLIICSLLTLLNSLKWREKRIKKLSQLFIEAIKEL
jgi:hypothetical protein